MRYKHTAAMQISINLSLPFYILLYKTTKIINKSAVVCICAIEKLDFGFGFTIGPKFPLVILRRCTGSEAKDCMLYKYVRIIIKKIVDKRTRFI